MTAAGHLRQTLPARLRLPVIAAPMFLVSGPELVVAACKAGVVGSLAALSARDSPELNDWLEAIAAGAAASQAAGASPAPFAVNLVVHRTNPRLDRDLAACVATRAPLVITSVGHDQDVISAVHAYGGSILHDVANLRHVEKAIDAGVDGLILLCAGAGGQVGRAQPLSPFAFAAEVRRLWPGLLVLAGGIADGRAIRAAEIIGADLAYVGTRFIATHESRANDAYKSMLLGAKADDVVAVLSPAGVWANLLGPSLKRAGIDPSAIKTSRHVDMQSLLDAGDSKLWRDVWAAGHGVGTITSVTSVANLIDELEAEYVAARNGAAHPG